MKNQAAQQLGTLGGKATSEAKAKAARKNAAKPRGVWVTATSFTCKTKTGQSISGVVISKGKRPYNPDNYFEWIESAIKSEYANIDFDFDELESADYTKLIK